MLVRPAPSFVERLRGITASRPPADPWSGPLATLKGKIGTDGVERLSTVAVYEALNLKMVERTPKAGKRVKALMEGLGWTAVRQVQLTPSGSGARMRGYARQR